MGKPRFDGVPAPARRAAKRAGAAPNYPTPREAREAGAAGQGGAPLPFRISLTQLGQPGFPCTQLPVQDEMHQPDPVSPPSLSPVLKLSLETSASDSNVVARPPKQTVAELKKKKQKPTNLGDYIS